MAIEVHKAARGHPVWTVATDSLSWSDFTINADVSITPALNDLIKELTNHEPVILADCKTAPSILIDSMNTEEWAKENLRIQRFGGTRDEYGFHQGNGGKFYSNCMSWKGKKDIHGRDISIECVAIKRYQGPAGLDVISSNPETDFLYILKALEHHADHSYRKGYVVIPTADRGVAKQMFQLGNNLLQIGEPALVEAVLGRIVGNWSRDFYEEVEAVLLSAGAELPLALAR
jgi:hypothetical protein